METSAHRMLKRMAIEFLRQSGCAAVATEVRCPISRYRIDVAGYLDRLPPVEQASRPRRIEPRTIVIECKQSREDFMRDNEDAPALVKLRTQLERMRQSIEQNRIRRIEPQLRREGTSLFAELDEWDFASSRLPAYRKVLRQLWRIDQKLHGATKFFLIGRYRLADAMYVAAPRGMVRRAELPPGWGLLECPPQCLKDGGLSMPLFEPPPALEEAVAAPEHASPLKYRLMVLRNIAVAASMAAERSMAMR